jgi:uncharacterized protein (DUF1501 family)
VNLPVCGCRLFGQHWDLLRQLSEAISAFYAATIELGIPDDVTTFTLSDFGRTLQPSGSGSDHGWEAIS